MLAMPNREGWVVVPKLPVREWGKAYKKLKEAGGVTGARSAWPGNRKADAEAYAKACTDTSGIEFVITECIY